MFVLRALYLGLCALYLVFCSYSFVLIALCFVPRSGYGPKLRVGALANPG